jgi:hypothetical protein
LLIACRGTSGTPAPAFDFDPYRSSEKPPACFSFRQLIEPAMVLQAASYGSFALPSPYSLLLNKMTGISFTTSPVVEVEKLEVHDRGKNNLGKGLLIRPPVNRVAALLFTVFSRPLSLFRLIALWLSQQGPACPQRGGPCL